MTADTPRSRAVAHLTSAENLLRRSEAPEDVDLVNTHTNLARVWLLIESNDMQAQRAKESDEYTATQRAIRLALEDDTKRKGARR